MRGKHLTATEIKAVREMLRDGLSVAAVSAATGIARATVEFYAKKWGLTRDRHVERVCLASGCYEPRVSGSRFCLAHAEARKPRTLPGSQIAPAPLSKLMAGR